MVSQPETGSDQPIGSDRDRGRDIQHLIMTRLDISFAVNKPSQFMHVPSEHHWGALKRLLRYLNGTRSLGN